MGLLSIAMAIMAALASGGSIIGVIWVIGLVPMVLAYSPPKLIAEFYTAAIGMLSAGLFVPTIAGLWWKKANLAGGMASLLIGIGVYLVVQFTPGTPPMSAILFGLPASALAMWLFSKIGPANPPKMVDSIDKLHTMT